jgi:hypothetical protein
MQFLLVLLSSMETPPIFLYLICDFKDLLVIIISKMFFDGATVTISMIELSFVISVWKVPGNRALAFAEHHHTSLCWYTFRAQSFSGQSKVAWSQDLFMIDWSQESRSCGGNVALCWAHAEYHHVSVNQAATVSRSLFRE